MRKISLIIFGLFLCIVLLEIGLRIEGFLYLSLQEYRNRISLKQKGEYRILCLGESTTALGGKHSYPCQLEEILNQRDMGLKFSVINKGVPGIDTGAIVLQLENDLNKYTPNMVITMMGTNDFGDILPYKDISISKIMPFLKELRTYKFIKLLKHHIINEAKRIGIYKQKEREKDISVGLNDLQHLINFKNQKELHEKAIETNAESDKVYCKLGRWYSSIGKYNEAEEMLLKAIEINPKSSNDIYIKLGICYAMQGKHAEAEEILLKAIKMNPKNYWAYIDLAWRYIRLRRYTEVEEMLKKAIEINQKNSWAYLAYVGLGWCYRSQGNYDKAEEILKKAITVNPESVNLYGLLAVLDKEQGKNKSAEEYFRKANRLRLEYYNPATRHNYQRLKGIITQREIKLVCVQYPMRSVEPLKRMIEPHEGILFVDNEMVFKKVLKQERLGEYFINIFGGDFGDCTPKGNRLLAENIANVILKKCFNIDKKISF